ncbi:MAG TPA: efflux RND transporter permease subunit, partial [Sediminispirochaeta sp.]|nr:efflux RND transporter permease subunit [Sediminispirochaeta sp.]
MNLSELSVKRPVTMVVLFGLLLVVAAIIVPSLAVDLYPDTSRPVLSVSTSYTGAGPEEVEQQITIPLENSLAAVTGLESMSSRSSFERSRIRLDFSYDVDLDEARAEVESILTSALNALPDEASVPSVFQFNLSSIPIMRLALRGDYPLENLRELAEDRIQAQLERIPGVASTSVSGGRSRTVTVEASQNRLAAFNLTLAEVASTLNGQEILVGGGNLLLGGTEYQLLTRESLD